MRLQTLVLLVIVVGSGLMAGLLTYNYMQAPPPTPDDMKEILIARQDIPAGSTIKVREMVETIQYPSKYTPPGAVDKWETIEGKPLRVAIKKGEPLVDKYFDVKDVGEGLQALLKDGRRAVTIPISTEKSVAGFIKPGSMVDIMHYRILAIEGTGIQHPETKTILQNIKVLAINTENTDTGPATQGKKVVDMVTFELTPEEAEKVTWAAASGQIYLAMRRPTDDKHVRTPGASIDNVGGNPRPRKDEGQKLEKVQLDDKLITQKPTALEGLLNAIMAQPTPGPEVASNTPEKTGNEPVKRTRVNEPSLPNVSKWLVYRDQDRKVLWSVPVDPHTPEGRALKDLLEDGRPEDEGESLMAGGPVAPRRNPKPVPPAPVEPEPTAGEQSQASQGQPVKAGRKR